MVGEIAGAMLFRPAPHVDERGFFSRTFDAEIVRAAGLEPRAFVQDSISRSKQGVVRGMHIRSGLGEAKLVRCSYGAIFDVIVDLRPASPTYREQATFELRGDEQVSLYVPAGSRTGFKRSPNPQTCRIASIGLTIPPKTSRSPSTTPISASTGRSGDTAVGNATGARSLWPRDPALP